MIFRKNSLFKGLPLVEAIMLVLRWWDVLRSQLRPWLRSRSALPSCSLYRLILRILLFYRTLLKMQDYRLRTDTPCLLSGFPLIFLSDST